jgi:hypothetical protein
MVFQNATGLSYSGFIGQIAAASQGVQEGVGYMNVSTSALPGSVGMNVITQSNFRSVVMPYMVFKNVTW